VFEQEPTTKNDLGVKHHKQNIQAYAHDFGVSEEQAETELRDTKNDLGVDLISRADAIQAMQDKAKKLTNEDTINGLCGAVAMLYEMPSVTPQPRKGHWIVAKGSYLGMRNACCSNCKDFYTNDWNVMNYCPNCGADMREVEE
jgi:hypothetical protein